MHAARYLGDAAIAVAELEPVPPGPTQVQIGVEFTGICGTDLHIRHGAMDGRVRVPAVLGHEMSGRITALGPGVSGWRVGDPVTVMPLRWCGSCPACLAGHRHICHRLDFLGIDSPGAMQQRWTVPSELLVRVPDGVPLRDAALVEPTAVAVHDVTRAGLLAGESAVVIGGGPVGVLIACVARSVGAEVVVVEPDPHRRRIAQQLGLSVLDPGGAPGGQEIEAEIRERTGGAGAAVAFEVSGSAPGLATALSVLAVRGRLVVVGIHSEPRTVDLHRVFLRELTLLGARVYERSDFERAVQLIADGTIPASRLVTRVEPLTCAAAAFAALESGGDVMKVLVDCAGQEPGGPDVGRGEE
ncbi:alcohol dehydrogenase catalytic domain-containing protein [Natronosporangium hydrolyticum]|uniref:Alcohol dehydrogenase catalytic domain-containing protein n=1 Tax=Natronosporangium hydrolyticum TaxID=2811111 RepID=A0A895Y5G8_9ACTN|nr:alcohol dehydrogenase catalytic domain-containing protein [Natronosporangium hydrolyticum]QSB12937.1 alcohol dehydrogenase catalytic domain-containing protein [Natronosporangium hydrolyticum]